MQGRSGERPEAIKVRLLGGDFVGFLVRGLRHRHSAGGRRGNDRGGYRGAPAKIHESPKKNYPKSTQNRGPKAKAWNP